MPQLKSTFTDPRSHQYQEFLCIYHFKLFCTFYSFFLAWLFTTREIFPIDILTKTMKKTGGIQTLQLILCTTFAVLLLCCPTSFGQTFSPSRLQSDKLTVGQNYIGQHFIQDLSKSVSEIRKTLDNLQRKLANLEGQVSGIDSHVFPGKSCDTIKPLARSQKKQTIYPNGRHEPGVDVLCDFETDGGGWTIIQKRSSGPKEEFYRNWTEYEKGFGSVDGNYWIGLKTIYYLVKDGDQELRVDLWDFEGDQVYAKYRIFSISDSLDFYRLNVAGYSGTARNSLDYHNQLRFSTKDEDHDAWFDGNCAEREKGAWWYNDCSVSNLNGFYFEKGDKLDPKWSGMFWLDFKDSYGSLRQVEMKIRRRR